MPRQRPPEPYRNSITAPTYQSASYFFDNEGDVREGLHEKSLPRGRYGRYDNPTWLHVENELTRLCDAEAALVFSSGMAAHMTAFLSLLNQGDHVVLPSESYRQVRNVFLNILPRYGVVVHEISIADPDHFVEEVARLAPELKLVHLEMPSSPHMYLIDIERIRAAVGPDVILTMDSSFACPPNFYALKWGVDLALFSGTKYLSGHGDIVVGAAVGRKDYMDEIQWHRDTTGSICDGQVAWLLARSLYTLPLRLNHANRQARAVAEFLEAHPGVARVYYTGLPSHPHHELGKKYLQGHGGVVTFELPRDEEETAKAVDRLKIPYMASNFGAPQTLIEQSTLFTYYEYSDEELERIGVTRGTVRLSLGYIDDVQALIADLKAALEA